MSRIALYLKDFARLLRRSISHKIDHRKYCNDSRVMHNNYFLSLGIVIKFDKYREGRILYH